MTTPKIEFNDVIRLLTEKTREDKIFWRFVGNPTMGPFQYEVGLDNVTFTFRFVRFFIMMADRIMLLKNGERHQIIVTAPMILPSRRLFREIKRQRKRVACKETREEVEKRQQLIEDVYHRMNSQDLVTAITKVGD